MFGFGYLVALLVAGAMPNALIYLVLLVKTDGLCNCTRFHLVTPLWLIDNWKIGLVWKAVWAIRLHITYEISTLLSVFPLKLSMWHWLCWVEPFTFLPISFVYDYYHFWANHWVLLFSTANACGSSLKCCIFSLRQNGNIPLMYCSFSTQQSVWPLYDNKELKLLRNVKRRKLVIS